MDPLDVISPLTEQHYQDIKNGLEAINKAKAQIALAKRAGLDVTAQEAAANDTERKLLQIKQVYFPNRS